MWENPQLFRKETYRLKMIHYQRFNGLHRECRECLSKSLISLRLLSGKQQAEHFTDENVHNFFKGARTKKPAVLQLGSMGEMWLCVLRSGSQRAVKDFWHTAPCGWCACFSIIPGQFGTCCKAYPESPERIIMLLRWLRSAAPGNAFMEVMNNRRKANEIFFTTRKGQKSFNGKFLEKYWENKRL